MLLSVREGQVKARVAHLGALSVLVTPDFVQALCAGCVISARASARTEHNEAEAMAEGHVCVCIYTLWHAADCFCVAMCCSSLQFQMSYSFIGTGYTICSERVD